MICLSTWLCRQTSVYAITSPALHSSPVQSRPAGLGAEQGRDRRGPPAHGARPCRNCPILQLVVLTASCQRPDRCVLPITAKLKGNAAGNVLKSLLNKGLIKEVRAKRDDTVWPHDEERGRMTLVATKAAFAALGIDPRDEDEDTETNAADSAPTDVQAEPNQRPKACATKQPKAPRTRDGGKQAQLIALLRRAKGATINEIAQSAFLAAAHRARRDHQHA